MISNDVEKYHHGQKSSYHGMVIVGHARVLKLHHQPVPKKRDFD